MSAGEGEDRQLLSPIADVRRGEAAAALLMALTMFLVLAAYYLLKTAREVFILSEGGAEVKSYSSAGQALLLLVLVPLYGAFASRVNRTAAGAVGHAVLRREPRAVPARARRRHAHRHRILPVARHLQRMVIAQFWAFAADLFSRGAGQALCSADRGRQQPGAWLGSLRAGQLDGAGGSAAAAARGLRDPGDLCGLAVVLDRIVRRTAASPSDRTDERVAAGPAVSTAALGPLSPAHRRSRGAAERGQHDRRVSLRPVRRQHGEAMFGAGARRAAARQQFIGESYSSFFSTISLVGFLLQLFVVSRVFRALGVGNALLVHPPLRSPAIC
jgi:AAA family ATP:ADP antiporter